MPQTTVNGASIYYEIRGREGEPVVFIHGSWTDHHQWDVAADGLAKRFRVLSFDRRGHSLSPRAARPGTHIDEDVADAAGLIEQHGFAPAHVAGNSLGAIIALRLVCQRPGLVRSVIAHEPPLYAFLEADPATRAIFDDIMRRLSLVTDLLRKGELRAGAERFVDTVALGPGAWKQLAPEVQETFVVNAQTFLEETEEPEAFGIDPAALRQVRTPCLLTHGELSPPFFTAIVERLGAAMPQAQRKRFAGAGHVPHMSHAAQYATEVTNFVGGIRL